MGTAAAGRRTATGQIADQYPAKVLKAAARKAGIPDAERVTGRSPRRSYITTQIRAGVDPGVVARHTGRPAGSWAFPAACPTVAGLRPGPAAAGVAPGAR